MVWSDQVNHYTNDETNIWLDIENITLNLNTV